MTSAAATISLPGMFTIIGGDGREYGPVSADQIRAWIKAGRANLETQARRSDSTEWCALGEFAEFSDGTVPPRLTPPPAVAPVAPVASGEAFEGVDEAELAGHGARIGAAFINLFVYLFSMLPGTVIATRRLMQEFPEMAQGRFISPDRIAQLDPGLLVQLAGLIYGGVFIAILLQAVLIAVRGQSLGKLLVGVRVARLDGGPAGAARAAILRYLLPVGFFFLLLFIPFVGLPLAMMYLMVDLGFMFRADRRCLHDLIAGTIVVKK